MTTESVQAFNKEWLLKATTGLDDKGRALVRRASEWAQKPLEGVKLGTGAPADHHAAGVVLILQRLGADAVARASALLTYTAVEHIALNDQKQVAAIIEALRSEFSSEVVSLVQGTHALLRLGALASQAGASGSSPGDQTEKQRKMLLAMAADLRIVLIRLASRLQTLLWYAHTKTPCPPNMARETLELYTPLANRLGIWQIKWEMEDLSFRFLEPDTYRKIAVQLEEKRAERESFIDATINVIQNELKSLNVNANVSGRPKHIYSIWNKMQNKNLTFDQLYDLRALRIIVNDERDCYTALALVHSLWVPVSEEFDDYISRPKPNGYRSLHTVVSDQQGRRFEIQIRTHEMHEFAEYGMAAHWRYKEAGVRGGIETASSKYDQKIAWMRQLLAFDGSDKGGSSEQAKAEVRQQPDRIYVLTPQARVIELPGGATPVDFAYHLHTDLGHRCRGARVDGQMVPLLTKLQTGQTVEIITAKSGGPSRDWLNPQLGFLASPRARAKVRAWFNAIELQERISQGQALVEKELQRLGKTAINLEHLAEQLGFARSDDMYVAVAKDEFSLRNIDNALRGGSTDHDETEKTYSSGRDSVTTTGKSGVLVVGVDSLLTQLARCCRPAPPDPICGFVTRGRGVSIHRADCSSYASLASSQPERLIEVAWGDTGQSVYPVNISVQAPETSSLLRDVSEVFARLRINVVGVNSQSRRSLTNITFTIEVRNGDQIQQAINALCELPGVTANRN